MKIFFINPPFKAEYGKFSRENRSPAITRSGTLYYPLWLIYAAAVCEKDGFQIEFLDAPAVPLNEEQSFGEIMQRGKGAKLFVIETSTPSIYSDIAFLKKVKREFPGAVFVMTGTHVSALPTETLKLCKEIDAVTRREYDYTIREIARCLAENRSWHEVRGITYIDGEEVISNPDMDYIDDLDEIPFAAEFIKNHLNYKDYFFAGAYYPEIQLFTGRGCPARCNYCVYPQTMHGHTYRLRSAENVVREFQYIVENFPDIRHIVIEDDTFTAKIDRVISICAMLIEKGINKKIKWLCNARVNNLDLKTMKLMKAAGCRQIIPGVESGNQEILNNIKKGTTLKQIDEYVRNAKKAGLLVHACYMVGNKGETRQTMEKTLELALRLNTDAAQFYPLLPFPGTEAYRWAKENHYLKGDYSDYVKEDGTINCVLEIPGLSSEEMVRFCDDSRKKYLLRPGYIMHRLWVGVRDPRDLKRALKAFWNIKGYLLKK